ncbi:hypothetical protein [Rossellomorea marisflavi]|uniref:hypothetical protein n=1 Tax=Rossellomorea marisflavi TaxID=189381 RepID=UPI003D2F43CC
MSSQALERPIQKGGVPRRVSLLVGKLYNIDEVSFLDNTTAPDETSTVEILALTSDGVDVINGFKSSENVGNPLDIPVNIQVKSIPYNQIVGMTKIFVNADSSLNISFFTIHTTTGDIEIKPNRQNADFYDNNERQKEINEFYNLIKKRT